jgi:hypothetical protein
MDMVVMIVKEQNLMILSKDLFGFARLSLFFLSVSYRSVNDMSGFNPRGGKSVQNVMPKGGRKGGAAGGKKINRPGKSVRNKQRTGRKK